MFRSIPKTTSCNNYMWDGKWQTLETDEHKDATDLHFVCKHEEGRQEKIDKDMFLCPTRWPTGSVTQLRITKCPLLFLFL